MSNLLNTILRPGFPLALLLLASVAVANAGEVIKAGGFKFVLPEGAREAKTPDGLVYGEPKPIEDSPEKAEAMVQTGESEEGDDFPVFTPVEPELASVVDSETTGAIVGQVLDKETTEYVSDVYVIVKPDDLSTDGEVDVAEGQSYFGQTDKQGAYFVEGIEPGTYSMTFVRDGYYEATIERIVIEAREVERFDFGLVERTEVSDEVYQLTDFVVTAAEAQSGRDALIQLRVASIGQVDFLSTEDFAKFGGSNLADLVNRLAGVNVVEGQFAVVRGLGDRYNSTLLNNLPVPSPDPIRQGVQLDLFPTSIVGGVVADKAFLPSLPANSSGAAFNLQTREYPEQLSFWAGTGVSVNENAKDSLLINRNARAPAGTPGGSLQLDTILGRGDFPIRDDFLAASPDSVGTIGGQSFKFGIGNTFDEPWNGPFSSIAFVASLSYSSSSSSTAEGRQQNQFLNENILPRPARPPLILPGGIIIPRPATPGVAGSALRGELPITGLVYDHTTSSVDETAGFLLGGGVVLDDEGHHKVDLTFLRSRSILSEVVRRDNGRLPDGTPRAQGFDRGFGSNGGNGLSILQDVVGRPTDSADGFPGNDFFTVGQDVLTVEERVLNARQISGAHLFDILGREIDLSWGYSESDAGSTIGNPDPNNFVAGQSTFLYLENVSGKTVTTEDLTDNGTLIPDLEPGAIFFADPISLAESFSSEVARVTARTIQDEQRGGRADLSSEILDGLDLKIGGFFSETEREAVQFDQLRSLPGVVAENNLEDFASEALRISTNTPIPSRADIEQEIADYYFQFDIELFDGLEVSAGGRWADVETMATGSGRIIPTIPLLGPTGFLGSGLPNNQNISNGSLIGYPDLDFGDPIEGEVDFYGFLPAASLKYTFWESWTFRLSYGETIALPSFRELSPFFTLDSVTGDRVFGNAFLEESEIKNFGTRLEKTFDDGTTNIAVSFFRKDIEKPIEQIGLLDRGTGTAVTSFFNNENDAVVEGVEIEGRLGLGLLAEQLDNWFGLKLGTLHYFSVGGNVAFIDASVGFPQAVEETYTNVSDGGLSPYANENGIIEFPEDRRLFDQPEYTVNFDVTFEQPEWGTRITVAVFAQSDVLSVVGSGSAETPDQFTLPYEKLDLTFSQEFGDGWEFEFTAENLTDSKRGLEFDSEVFDAPERLSYKVGRSFGVSLSYTF